MCGRLWVVPVVIFCVQLVSGQAKVPASQASSESAIQAVLQAQVEAWNRGDLKGFMKGYWKSPDLIFAGGAEETHGWDPVFRRYQARYQNHGNEMGKLSFDLVNGVHVMSPEFAYVDGEYHLKTSPEKESRGVFTLIFRKFPEGWRIIHDRTCGE